MMTRTECLLRIEDDFNIARLQFYRLPTGSNDDPTSNTKRLHRFSPPLVPILMRKGLHQNVGPWLAPSLHLLKYLPKSNAMLRGPTLTGPINVDRVFVLPTALNKWIGQKP